MSEEPMRIVMPDRVDDFDVVVRAGVWTQLPNGCAILLSGSTGNYEVRGSMTDQGPAVEIISYMNSGQPLHRGPWEPIDRSATPDQGDRSSPSTP